MIRGMRPYGHLLRFRDQATLLAMGVAERERLMLEVIAGPASEATWRAALELFATWPDGPHRDGALTRADAALARWPDALRLVSPSWGPFFRKGPSPAPDPVLRLARCVRLDGGSAGSQLVRIVRSPHASGLTQLVVVGHSLGVLEYAALGDAAFTGRLTKLVLSDGTIPPVAVTPLASALGALRELTLQGMSLTPDDLAAWLGAGTLQGLRELHLSDNRLDDGAARLLARCPTLGDVERLDSAVPGGRTAVAPRARPAARLPARRGAGAAASGPGAAGGAPRLTSVRGGFRSSASPPRS